MSRKLAIALLALSTLAHWPIGHTDFTYDDKDFIENNASIRSFGAAARALLAPFPPEQPERGLYRPLTNLSYAADFAVFETASFGYHVVNTALYLCVVLLFYALARVYFCGRRAADEAHPSAAAAGRSGEAVAFAAALLFSVHPVHCDAVDSLSGRSELLALGFSLASLRVFLAAAAASRDRVRGLAFASAGLYALGCASKETAMLLPAVALLHLLALEERPRGARALASRYLDLALPMLGVLLLYLGFRLQMLGGFGPAAPVLAGIDPVARLATMGSVFLEYARLLVFPGTLALDFYYQVAVGVPQTIGWRSAFGLVLAASALVALAWATRSSWVSGTAGADRADDVPPLAGPAGLVLAGLGSGLVFLAPVSHVVGIGALMAERFLFAPSFGFVLCAAGLAAHFGPRLLGAHARTSAIAVVAVLGVAGFARSAARAAEWRDGVELWRSTERHIPDDYRVHSNVAAQLIARDRLEEAEASLRRALELEPGELAAWTNLAVVLTEQKRFAEAQETYRRVIGADPGSFVAWYNLGVIETLQHRDSDAITYFERSLAVNPNHEPARRGLATTRDRIEKARRFLHENAARAAESQDPKLLDLYARACRMTGDFACSERFEERARRAAEP